MLMVIISLALTLSLATTSPLVIPTQSFTCRSSLYSSGSGYTHLPSATGSVKRTPAEEQPPPPPTNNITTPLKPISPYHTPPPTHTAPHTTTSRSLQLWKRLSVPAFVPKISHLFTAAGDERREGRAIPSDLGHNDCLARGACRALLPRAVGTEVWQRASPLIWTKFCGEGVRLFVRGPDTLWVGCSLDAGLNAI